MSRCVMLVDDEPHVTRLLRTRLEALGYEVAVAGNGEQALEALRSRAIDLVVTDLCMPGMDGRELCESLRAELGEKAPPVFLTTSRPEDEIRSWTADLPNVEFMEKPVSPRRLLESIRERLGPHPQESCE